MYIRSFGVKNFMIHRDSAISLFPVTVLVGPNNGGKSALFDALLNFSMVSRGRLSQAFGPGPYGFNFRKHHGSSPAARISFDVVLAAGEESDEALRYEISYARQKGMEDSYVIYDERITDLQSGNFLFDRANADDFPMGDTISQLTSERSIFAAIRAAQLSGQYVESNALVTHSAREISRLSKYRLDPLNLARPSRLPDIQTEEPVDIRVPRIDYRGEDLPSVLYYLSETRNDALDDIVKRVSEVLTGFEGFEFNLVGTERIGFSIQFSDSRGTVPAANLSDGTLSLIGMMTLLLSPDRPSVLCIEEPENGLTPHATRIVYEAIRQLARNDESSRRSQVLISSHSPFVICASWNDEERGFIYQVKPVAGSSLIRPFAEIIDQNGVQLRMAKGERRLLGLEMADQIMEGYYS